jgi:GT2 family glycosyltransferase/glycosyltransferase involved in cell wall biosynthesis
MSIQLTILGTYKPDLDSIVRLLNMKGESFKKKNITNSNHNLLGYNEISRINNILLFSSKTGINGLCCNHPENIDEKTIKEFRDEAKIFFDKFSVNKTCLVAHIGVTQLLPYWKQTLTNPIFIILNSNPVMAAKDMYRQHSIPINIGIAMWEHNIRTVLRESVGLPRVIISHEEILSGLRNVTRVISDFLVSNGIGVKQNLKPYSWDGNTEKLENPDLHKYLTGEQLELFNAIDNRSVMDWDEIPALSEISRVNLDNYNKIKELEHVADLSDEAFYYIARVFKSRQYSFGRSIGGLIRFLTRKPFSSSLPERCLRNLRKKHSYTKLSRFKQTQQEHTWNTNVAEPKVRDKTVRNKSMVARVPFEKVDVIVCIHNAIEYVMDTLESLSRTNEEFRRLIIVNDASDIETTGYLDSFERSNAWCNVIKTQKQIGYTGSANIGMKHSNAEIMILLNSDTIVPKGWINKLSSCIKSDPAIGLAGALSNAATWQSIPRRRDENDGWAINKMPVGCDINEMNHFLDLISEKKYPEVPSLNGFCISISRDVIDKIGYLDENNFPKGYGEETDYCLRARKKGFKCAIADDLYIYHSKSKSFGLKVRNNLSSIGNDVLKRKHSKNELKSINRFFYNEPVIARLRAQVKTAIKHGYFSDSNSFFSSLKVIFLLPTPPGGGGVHSVFQEAEGMNRLGSKVLIAAPAAQKRNYYRFYKSSCDRIFYFYSSEDDLILIASEYDYAIATHFKSVKLLNSVIQLNPEVLPAYYIQDYEPWICGHNFLEIREAKKSYGLLKNMLCFAKTDWIRQTVMKYHGIEVKKVTPSLDHNIFYPDDNYEKKLTANRLKIVSMVRPRTPRRQTKLTMKLLKNLKAIHKDRIEIEVFGCDDNELEKLKSYTDFDFHNHGILIREEIAEIYRNSSFFIDMSTYQAFGRTGIESMACGCIPVLPEIGGVYEYAVNNKNALIVPTKSIEAALSGISRILEDTNLMHKLIKNGIETCERYSIEKAALSEIMVLASGL